MHSSPSLCPSASGLGGTSSNSVTFSLPNTLFLSTIYNHKRLSTSKFILLAALHFSSKDSSNTTPSDVVPLLKKTHPQIPFVGLTSLVEENKGFPIAQQEQNSNLDTRIFELHLLQGFLDEIKALPITHRNEFLHVIKKDYRFETISTFNNLLTALYMADEVDLALILYSDLSFFLLQPSYGTFALLIRCYCKKNDPFKASDVLNEMVEKGLQPNVALFTELINSFSKRGRMQKAFEVWELMERVKCEPTINTYNCLLKGLCYVGRIEEAYKMLVNIKKSSTELDIYTYTAVMNGFCKVGRSDEALELLDEALEMGLVPNVVTYNTLFNGYFKEGRPLEGISLLNKMKERNCMPDRISYSTLLHGLLKWGKIHSALGIYKEMIGVGFEVEERMMNTLLRGLCRRSRTESVLLTSAYEVFERMTSGGYCIHPCAAYDLVIEAFCLGKHMDKALATLNDMRRLGHSPRMITISKVIQALCDEDYLEEAISVLVLMNDDNRIAAAFPFDMLINKCNCVGLFFCACNVYGAALKRGVTPQMKPTSVGQHNSKTPNVVNCDEFDTL